MTCIYCSKKLKGDQSKWCSKECSAKGNHIAKMVDSGRGQKRIYSPADLEKFERIKRYLNN